jgi:thiamine pyrophosphokinase
MRVYIFLHGDRFKRAFYKRHFDLTSGADDLVICADGGYATARSLAIEPQIVVGDLDSLRDVKITEGTAVFKHPTVKDFSDFELALNEALKLEPEIIFVYGALGGRKDHEIINVNLLAHADIPLAFIEQDVEIYNVIKELEIIGKKGKICSLVTFQDGCHISIMEGFEYLLKDEVLPPSSRGLSNIITQDRAYINIKKGRLIVIVTSEAVD